MRKPKWLFRLYVRLVASILDDNPHDYVRRWRRARACVLIGRPDEAEREFSKLIDFGYNVPDCRREIALIAYDRGDENAARDVLRKTVEEYPDHEGCAELLGHLEPSRDQE